MAKSNAQRQREWRERKQSQFENLHSENDRLHRELTVAREGWRVQAEKVSVLRDENDSLKARVEQLGDRPPKRGPFGLTIPSIFKRALRLAD